MSGDMTVTGTPLIMFIVFCILWTIVSFSVIILYFAAKSVGFHI